MQSKEKNVLKREKNVILSKEGLLSLLIFVGMLLGIIIGIVFGERCSIFGSAGNFFIALMQACVLPYIFFSILYSFGNIDRRDMGNLWKKLIFSMLIVLVPTMLLFRFIPLSFPDWVHTPLYSIAQNAGDDVSLSISMFVSNPITAMANNYVPALVIFCLATGFILQRTPNKDTAMSVLRTSRDVLIDFSHLCGYIVPVCICAIIANIVGCTPLSELYQVRVYMITFGMMSVFLFFVMLPLLLKIFYPFRYMDIMRAMRFPCLTVLLTGNIFIALPMTNEIIADFFEKYDFERQKIYHYSSVLVPLFFLFPGIGRMSDVIFVSFAAWQNNIALGFDDKLIMDFIAYIVGFGSSSVGVPFLLKCFNLPQNMFDVFLFSDFIINLGLKSAFGLLSFFCTTAICILLLEKHRPRLRKLFLHLGFIVLLAAGIAVSIKLFWKTQNQPENERKILAAMRVDATVPWTLCDKLPEEPRSSAPILEQIFETRTLRVGFVPEVKPCSYIDDKGNPAGLEIQLLQMLAAELDCTKIEFYPISYADLQQVLDERRVDVVAGHLYVTKKRLGNTLFARPHLNVPVAFMAKRERIAFLRENPSLLKSDEISISVIDDEEIPMLRHRGVKGKIVNIKSYANFTGSDTDCDLMCISADVAAVYCVQHPEFDYYVSPGMYENVIAFALPAKAYPFAHYLDYWMTILEKNGTLDAQRQYWISGIKVLLPSKHWSLYDAILDSRTAPVRIENFTEH